MATKDIWQAGIRTIKTPAGHITQAPASASDEELADLVIKADHARLVDPAAQERDARAVIRRARWERVQAENKAYRAHLTEQGWGGENGYPDDMDHERYRAEWTRTYRASAATKKANKDSAMKAHAKATEIREALAARLAERPA